MSNFLSYLRSIMVGKSMWHFIVFDVVYNLSPLQWYAVQSLYMIGYYAVLYIIAYVMI